MRLLRSLIGIGVHNPVLANVLMISLLVGGVLAAGKLVRETFPPFSIDIVTVDVVHPGASPETVEDGIITKLDEALQGIPGVSEVSSVAKEGVGTVYLSLLDDADADSVIRDVKDRVDALTIRKACLEDMSVSTLTPIAVAQGNFRTIMQDGLEKVMLGWTTVREVIGGQESAEEKEEAKATEEAKESEESEESEPPEEPKEEKEE